MVGRPRQFDPDQALDQAMVAFWANGYEATSMSDLIEATGLHKGSLYQAFGNKHQLFVAALKRYLGEMRAEKNALLAAAESPLDGLRTVMHAMVDKVDTDSEIPMGCMAINTLAELGPQDPEVYRLMEEHLGSMRQSMIEVIVAGQAQGQIGGSRPPELISMMLITFMSGLSLEMKGPVSKDEAHQLLDQQLAAVL